ncbi:hypothetical protein L195_g042410 [Trifolium pratense]|uniref:Uncharacterized protein n=1 Tax=Trifolium pratense TaxID=57577 RepID=A0A2K3M6B1_TRIPR|nr:hypothetical protein L195_g042410 [Trifolium pratense]
MLSLSLPPMPSMHADQTAKGVNGTILNGAMHLSMAPFQMLLPRCPAATTVFVP